MAKDTEVPGIRERLGGFDGHYDDESNTRSSEAEAQGRLRGGLVIGPCSIRIESLE